MAEDQSKETKNRTTDDLVDALRKVQAAAQRPLVEALRPEVRKQYDAKVKELGYEPLIEVDNENWHAPKAPVFKHTPPLDVVFEIPSIAMHWTVELAKLTVPTDEWIANNRRPLDEKSQARVDVITKKHGFAPIKALYSEATDHARDGSIQSRDGTYYLVLTEATLNGPDLEGVIVHELGHIAGGHLTVEMGTRLLNLPAPERMALERQHEREADAYAVERCVGPQLASSLIADYADIKFQARQKSKAQAQKYEDVMAADEAADPHPPSLHRIADITEAHINAIRQGQCKSPEVEAPEQAPRILNQKPVVKGPRLP